MVFALPTDHLVRRLPIVALNNEVNSRDRKEPSLGVRVEVTAAVEEERQLASAADLWPRCRGAVWPTRTMSPPPCHF